MERPGGGEALPVAHPVDLVEGRSGRGWGASGCCRAPGSGGGRRAGRTGRCRRVDGHRGRTSGFRAGRGMRRPCRTSTRPSRPVRRGRRRRRAWRRASRPAGRRRRGCRGWSTGRAGSDGDGGDAARPAGRAGPAGSRRPRPARPRCRRRRRGRACAAAGGVDGRVADQHEGPAPEPALHGQRQPEGARRRLDDDGARLEQPVVAGPVEDVPGGQQLHQAEGGAEEVGSEVDDPGKLQCPGDGDGHVRQGRVSCRSREPDAAERRPALRTNTGPPETGRLTADGR